MSLLLIIVGFLLLADAAVVPEWATTIAGLAVSAIGLLLHFIPSVPSKVVTFLALVTGIVGAGATYAQYLPPKIGAVVLAVATILAAVNQRLGNAGGTPSVH